MRNLAAPSRFCLLGLADRNRRRRMNGLIYLIGLIVVIMAVLSFFGLR
jgi:predicted nucleic acid-binding Zn ribbon protein